MATENKKSNNDSFDINELAYLDEDITPEFIEKLQRETEIQAKKFATPDGKLDVNMFEDVQAPQSNEVIANTEDAQPDTATQDSAVESMPVTDVSAEAPTETGEVQDIQQNENNNNDDAKNKSKEHEINAGFDENFIKKYKAKLNKQPHEVEKDDFNLRDRSNPSISDAKDDGQSIEELSNGKITERDISKEQQQYNESLDYDDDNIKYSKYVVYINPENIEFIDSLTVKERKNLINKILSEQGILVLSKKRADYIKSILKHLFLAIITVAIMLPVIYKIFNFSLETTIDNYHRSQSNFQTLYREKGKIKPVR